MAYSIESLRTIKLWLNDQKLKQSKLDQRDQLAFSISDLVKECDSQLVTAYENDYNSRHNGSYFDDYR